MMNLCIKVVVREVSWKLCSKLSFSKEAKKIMRKICSVVLKICLISWLEKFMRKSYKYHKSCAAKLSSNNYVEKSYTYMCCK